jgi:two-component system, OmpR family, phosphate regulon sensor histidine kinase PhoR
MKNSTPRQMAVNIALLSALVSGLFFLVFGLINGGIYWWLGLLGILSVFTLVYFLVRNVLRDFIFEKIVPIYKAIQKQHVSDEEMQKLLGYNDMVAQARNDVLDWGRERAGEIEQLKSLETYRKEFLGNVSHELKTPIFNIQGYVLTLLDGGIDDPEVNKLYLERTEKSINRLISIVEDLESISRLESGDLKLEFEHFDIIQLFEEVFEMQDMRAHKHDITLSFNHRYDKALMVYADRNRILEVVNNLVVNSIKYGNKHGRTIVSFSDLVDNVMIEISDNGIGISEKDISRIFERFYRVDKSRSREQGGTGLGLSIAKHIIEAHKQTIRVRSTPGAGTTFTFTLQHGKNQL